MALVYQKGKVFPQYVDSSMNITNTYRSESIRPTHNTIQKFKQLEETQAYISSITP
jgi:hypothetical protein